MHTKRLPMTSDLVFRTVLGRDTPECKQALIAMLNLILDRKEDPIVDLEYKNPFHLNEYMIGKQTVMDIKVFASSGEIINVEMQVENLMFYANRSVLYTGQLSAEGLESGEDYDKIKRVIHVSIVSGEMKTGSDKYHGIYRYMEVDDKTELSDLVELHYLKLNRLPKKPVEEMTALEQFGYYIACAGEEKQQEEIETLVKAGEEAIVLADTILRKASQEEILREKERARKMWEMDQRVYQRLAKKEAEEEGMKRGLEKGLAKGLQQGIEQGIEQGRQQGIQQGVRILIETCMELGLSREAARSRVMEKYDLSEDEAEACLQKYENA